MSQLQDGQRYAGRPTGAASVYENEKGSLVVCMEISVEGENLRYFAAIATEANGINQRTVDSLKKMFGWDGLDPFWFVDHGADYAEREVEATIEMKPSRDGSRFFPNIKYLDPPGESSGGAAMPEAGNRASLLAKYGSKFRAIAGGAPAAKTPPAAPKAPPTIRQIMAPPSDQAACWARFCELGGTEDGWFKAIAAAVPGVDQGDLTPAQWGLVLKHIESDTLPM